MEKSEKKLLEMLSYKRKEGSVGQHLFNMRFVQPMMGRPDKHGNYICEVVDGKVLPVNDRTELANNIAFMAHHDTVHRTDGRQKVIYDPHLQRAYVDHNECLGADCTTGVWLILEMIRNKVDGLYIVHTGEECGGIGSSAIVRDKPEWLNYLDFAISFDRYGTNSIITHQMGQRCCSESFVEGLESVLNLGLKSDSGGSYTDSYEYVDIVSECTNISVGYYNQHTKSEYQDMGFAKRLRDALVKADWSQLKPYRDPSVVDYDWGSQRNPYKSIYGYDEDDYYTRVYKDTKYATPDDVETLLEKYGTMEKLIEEFPYEVAELLSEFGYSRRDLAKAILEVHNFK